MKHTKELSRRHKDADKQLKQLAYEALKKKVWKKELIPIAARLGCNYQTIVNYIEGQGKDGYFKDLLIEEFSKK